MLDIKEDIYLALVIHDLGMVGKIGDQMEPSMAVLDDSAGRSPSFQGFL